MRRIVCRFFWNEHRICISDFYCRKDIFIYFNRSNCENSNSISIRIFENMEHNDKNECIYCQHRYVLNLIASFAIDKRINSHVSPLSACSLRLWHKFRLYDTRLCMSELICAVCKCLPGK